MPSKQLVMAPKMDAANFSSVELITVRPASTSIKALLGSTCTLYSDLELFEPCSTEALIPIFCNAVTRFCILTEPQWVKCLGGEEISCSFPSNLCLLCSTNNSPFSLAILILSCSNFVHWRLQAKSAAISKSRVNFKLGIRTISYSEY